MYKSPIELLIRDVQHQIIERENEQVYRAAVQVVPNIDKDELLRALAYDRGQYQRGYLDGLHDAAPRWIPVEERLPEEGGLYLVVVKYKYDHEEDFNYDVDAAIFCPWHPDAYIDNQWNTFNDWDEGQQYLHVTHWMPLPELPKGE